MQSIDRTKRHAVYFLATTERRITAFLRADSMRNGVEKSSLGVAPEPPPLTTFR